MFEGKSAEIIDFATKNLSPFTINGDEIVPMLCPFCGGGRRQDRNTFAINMYDGGFNCKRGSCAAKGGFTALAQHFGEQAENLNRRGIKLAQRDKTYTLPQLELLPLTEEIIDYFDTRKISRGTLEMYKVASSVDGNIVFPFYNKSKLIFVKHRHPWKPREGERKEWAERNTQPILFGMDECSFNYPLVITEGMLDSLSLVEAGIPNAVSVPSGVSNFEWVSPCWEFLERFNKVIIFGDNDEPGKEMVDTLVLRLGEDRCYIISEYPLRPDGKPCKDANEILYFLGPEALRKMVEEAEAVPIKGLIDLGDVVPIDPTNVPRIRIGIKGLDEAVGGLHEGDVIVLTGKSGEGKLLADCTPILTRNGWKNHGDLVIGDEVFSPDGDFVKVTHVFPKGTANMAVTFTNGETIYCHENHEWPVETHSGNTYRSHIVDTKYIYEKQFVNDGTYWENPSTGLRFKSPLRKPIAGEHKELPVKPYTLGAWIGDGRNGNPDITLSSGDTAIIDKIIEDGYPISWQTEHKDTGVLTFGFKDLRLPLQALGLCNSRRVVEKYIPEEYLTASTEQRLELLAGLIDTDGYLDTNGRVRYTYATTDDALKDGFVDLISTFGWRASVYRAEPKLSTSGIQGRKAVYSIHFSPSIVIPCRVDRKKTNLTAQHRRYSYKSIERIEPIQGNCIEVEGGLYCAGKTMVPTHNSTLSGSVLLNAIEQGKVVCAYSGELSKEKFQAWINLQCAGSEYITIKHDPIRGKPVPFLTPQVQERIRDWYRGKFFLFDNTEVFETDEQTSILKTFSVAARRYGASVFLVDNLMTSVADSDDELKAQGAFVTQLKKFAKRFKASVILVAHPRKTKAGESLRKDDVSGNSAIVNLCDTGISVERPDLRIIKNREDGIERLIECAYALDSRRIFQADTGDTTVYSWDKSGLALADPRADSFPEFGIQLSQNSRAAQPF